MPQFNIQKYQELSDDAVREIQNKIESVSQEISNVSYEAAGEPDLDDSDAEFYENQYNNSPEVQLDSLFSEKEALEERLFKDSYYRNLKQFIHAQKETLGKYSSGILLSDFDTSEDLLNRKPQATQLANYILTNSTGNSFNIGVLGSWGSGKTTFLNFIKEQITQEKKDNKDISCLTYDASSYSDQTQIWANFAKLLFEKYENETFFPHIRYWLSKTKKSWKKNITSFVLTLILLLILFILTIGINFSFSFNSLFGKFIGYGCSISGLILLCTQIIIPWTKKALSASIPLSQKILGEVQLPSYIDTLGSREKICNELDILFESWLSKPSLRIVVFVDELDRCSDKGIAEFFQAIQLFSSTQKIIFVFAIEPSHLHKALSKTYAIDENSIEIFTKEYLDKYVSLVIHLDNKIQYENLIPALISNVNDTRISITAEEVTTIQSCIQVIPYKYLTPRKIKKLINLLSLSKDYCINNFSETPINYTQLFSWIIFNCFLHDAAEYIACLFTRKLEFTPLKSRIDTNLSIQKQLRERLAGINYIPLIENLTMHDIVVYHKIANDFSIII